MSWAEFILRSIGFRQKQEREERLFREVTYQAHSMQYIFGGKKPPKIDTFWKIGNEKPKTSRVTEEQRAAYLKAFEQYKKESQ